MRREGNKITGDKYRITVLTDRLLRLEYEEGGHFTDEHTIRVINRDFPEVELTDSYVDGKLHLETPKLSIVYDERPFSPQGLCITLETGEVWNYGDPYIDTTQNLGGTARTLDISDGPVPLEKGLFSKKGCTLLDDSDACLLIDNEVVEREYNEKDLYFFAYGTDYAGGLKALAMLTGKTPMIPRYALGNWWSKYEKYTEESYMELLGKFEEEQVPVSVAVIDMDWHVVEIDPKYGHGWTGFTWNKEYFPDYKRFLKTIHDKGIAATLNLHPADGIRASEEMYPTVAEAMGLDPKEETAVAFDLTDPKFRKTYFGDVLHPYEEAGVDFWWIDWQQGTKMGETTCDPLWLCNHYHFQDQQERGKRAMIFSRYAGWGSHRYPIGFSGDTKITWASLNFQPYFTLAASNIAFGWWSHDIGGHMHGDKDLERYVRWVELGVFTPIMRLHSSSSPFFVKEPWRIEAPYRQIVDEFMRLRHRMVPYIYTQNYINWKEDMPLVRPMYYENSADARSYENPNEYRFGDAIIAGFITAKQDEELHMGSVSMYLPEGTYYDFFTGKAYKGGSKRRYYRKMDRIPVFIPEGKIVTFAGEDCMNATEVPEHIDLYVGPGKDGETFLYEDDGVSTGYLSGAGCKTVFKMQWDGTEKCSMQVSFEGEDLSYMPEKRRVTLHLLGAESADGCTAEETGVCMDFEVVRGTEASVEVNGVKMRKRDFRQEVFDLMNYAWTTTDNKDMVYGKACEQSLTEFRQTVREMELSTVMIDALEEILQNCEE